MHPEMTGPTDAQQAIAATNRKFEEAFNAGDSARVAREVYTRDARVLPPGAPTIQGRDQIEQFWPVAVQQLGIQAVQLETLELEVQGDTAYELGRATLTLAGGQQAVAKYVVVWKQEGGEWRWHVDIWNSNE